jgi:hypothetical protein
VSAVNVVDVGVSMTGDVPVSGVRVRVRAWEADPALFEAVKLRW